MTITEQEDAPRQSEVTSETLYRNRRKWLATVAGRTVLLTGSVAATAAAYRFFQPDPRGKDLSGELTSLNPVEEASSSNSDENGFRTSETPTQFYDIANYNNFYEFTTVKERVAKVASKFKTDGWSVEIDGLVDRPTKLSMSEIMALGAQVERIYRMRCVEAWSMIIPWTGLALSDLLEHVRPQSSAKFVRFETLMDPARMPGQKTNVLEWPYVEALRLDEAMHPLTLLATGIYRKSLPPQDGAPLRLVVPWKYGFKGIKSIVKITLTEELPETTWSKAAPWEYGFYANVNPRVDHPRWSQASEQRIGERGRRKTLMFNGYESQVASMYEGLDLQANF